MEQKDRRVIDTHAAPDRCAAGFAGGARRCDRKHAAIAVARRSLGRRDQTLIVDDRRLDRCHPAFDPRCSKAWRPGRRSEAPPAFLCHRRPPGSARQQAFPATRLRQRLPASGAMASRLVCAACTRAAPRAMATRDSSTRLYSPRVRPLAFLSSSWRTPDETGDHRRNAEARKRPAIVPRRSAPTIATPLALRMP